MNPFDNRPIGIFDSGLGGLTVVRALRKALPEENLCYLGDTARVPYGDKSVETIIRFGCEDTRFLLNKGVKLVIAACNTVSAVAMSDIVSRYRETPVIGVLEAGVAACLRRNPDSITVIGTKATIGSDAYRRRIHAQNPGIVVNSIATPLFVPLVEEGLLDSSVTEKAMLHYLAPVIANPPDLLLLGCTHYPLLFPMFRKFLPMSVEIIDSAQACADYAVSYLSTHGMGAAPGQNPSPRFCVTDVGTDFIYQASRFFGEPIRHAEHARIDVSDL